MPPATQESNGQLNGYPTDHAYPSRNIAFQAAGMITSIIDNLQTHDELRFTPAFMYVASDHVFLPPQLMPVVVCIACSLHL